MPFKPNDSNINKSGRPKGSLNNATKIKQQIQSMLADLIHNELSTDKLLNTLDKASPTAKLNLTRASHQLGVSRADVFRLALQDYLERLDIDYLKADEIIDINQLKIEL